jgi:hypothetical protein
MEQKLGGVAEKDDEGAHRRHSKVLYKRHVVEAGHGI